MHLKQKTRLHFIKNIRQYNHIFAFASIKTSFDQKNFDNNYNNGRYGFIYKCHATTI